MRRRERRGGKGRGGKSSGGEGKGEGKNDLMHPCHKFLATPLQTGAGTTPGQ